MCFCTPASLLSPLLPLACCGAESGGVLCDAGRGAGGYERDDTHGVEMFGAAKIIARADIMALWADQK